MSLKFSLLALLSRQPKTGYDLSKEVEGSTGQFWSATHQQIYKELADLLKRGWVRQKEVSQSEKPDKKVYSTTKEGNAELKRWLKEPTEPPPSKDAFLIKLFVGDLVGADVILEDLLRNRDFRQRRLKKFREIEKTYFQKVDSLPIERQFQYMTLRRGIALENAWISWSKEVEEFLKSKSELKK